MDLIIYGLNESRFWLMPLLLFWVAVMVVLTLLEIDKEIASLRSQ